MTLPRKIADSDTSAFVKVTRFWRQVQQGEPDECWPWTGYLEKDGYGQYFFEGRMIGAHELAVTFTTGERRHPSLDTCHSCDNPICCNPSHLRFGTRMDNVDDMHDRGRAKSPRTPTSVTSSTACAGKTRAVRSLVEARD